MERRHQENKDSGADNSENLISAPGGAWIWLWSPIVPTPNRCVWGSRKIQEVGFLLVDKGKWPRRETAGSPCGRQEVDHEYYQD